MAAGDRQPQQAESEHRHAVEDADDRRGGRAYGPGSADAEAVPSELAAVTDWPSGPSTIHSVGTSRAGTRAVRQQASTRSAAAGQSVANRLMPNIA